MGKTASLMVVPGKNKRPGFVDLQMRHWLNATLHLSRCLWPVWVTEVDPILWTAGQRG